MTKISPGVDFMEPFRADAGSVDRLARRPPLQRLRVRVHVTLCCVIFRETHLTGAYVIDPEPSPDERGLFARTWCDTEFGSRGLSPRIRQCSTSFNSRRGTLRGMHYQAAPYAEVRLVRCTRGAIHDVIIDLRPDSPTFCRYFGVELTAENRRAVYVPEGFAHGFQTLEDCSEVFYQMSESYRADHARGVRWDDPTFGIVWPDTDERVMSTRDRQYPDFRT
jgi:dTDP-4-dehydrorhamnose 3,5-epimerase